MRISLKKEVREKVDLLLKEFRSLGFFPKTRLSADVLDVTAVGDHKTILIQPEIEFSFFIPEKLLEIEKDTNE